MIASRNKANIETVGITEIIGNMTNVETATNTEIIESMKNTTRDRNHVDTIPVVLDLRMSSEESSDLRMSSEESSDHRRKTTTTLPPI